MKARLVLLFAAIGLSLAVCEAALRVLGYGYLNAPTVSDPVLHHVHPANYVFRSYDPGGEFGGYLVRYDAEGLRVDPDAPPPAPARWRLAVLGDSFVEALQVPYGETIAGRLAAASAGSAAVRNYGVTGYSPIIYYLQWTARVRSWRPTHVFVLLYSNDIDDDREYGSIAKFEGALPVAVPGAADNRLALWLHHLYVARVSALAVRRIAWRLGHRTAASDPVVGGYIETNPAMTPLTSTLLDALAARVREAGAELLLSAVPSKARLVHRERPAAGPQFADACREWARAHAVPFVDLVPAFTAATDRGEQLFLPTDIHLSAAGNAVAAREICGALPAFCR